MRPALLERRRGGAIEIKSGATIASDWFDVFPRFGKTLPRIVLGAVVYGGEERQSRRDGEAIPLSALGDLPERFDGRERA